MHSNSLATITSNWIYLREAYRDKHSLVLIESIAAVKTIKTIKIYYLACAWGSFLMAVATLCSKEADGATLPFGVLGLLLLAGNQITRQVSLALIIGNDTIRTAYGSVQEAATVRAAIQSGKRRPRRDERRAYDLYSWVCAYIAVLV